MNYRTIFVFIILLLLLTGCERPNPPAQIIAVNPPVVEAEAADTATPEATATAVSPPTATPIPPTATATLTPTPFYTGPLSSACGQLLPILPTNKTAVTTNITPNDLALAHLEAIMPDVAQPAMDRILEAPKTIGLAVYRVGDEANGVYLNADLQMPLASVAKVITLVAYAEAVANGEINETGIVTLDELDQYYLPNFDLGAHPRAIQELENSGKLLTNPNAVLMQEVPWMMVRHSSNAAADYLHMLLGQERVEETAVSLNLTSQTAPCTFIGQFLAMGNHTRLKSENQAAINSYIADPLFYVNELTQLADAYTSNPDFRAAEQTFRSNRSGPTMNDQRLFSESLNAHGSASDYANLMALIAQNGLSSSESSFIARRVLEWPMQFAVNQEIFSNLGYKNGSLPGILTTVYYAYPIGESAPVVIALFYQDLPNNVYRQWRNSLPHDEFARWILGDPAAIPALRAVINP
ncbi:MAG: serine hydrolase [Anaerolineales bacterium]|nr:serine hydrolase [Anaerolineales bacterium]